MNNEWIETSWGFRNTADADFEVISVGDGYNLVYGGDTLEGQVDADPFITKGADYLRRIYGLQYWT